MIRSQSSADISFAIAYFRVEISSIFLREIEIAIVELQAHLENPGNHERPFHRKTSSFREMIKKINQLNERIELAVHNRLHLSDA